ncbi:hypothetical protein NYR78_03015 [Actinobacillus equuli subsp. haemolyticus]|nr:hypothetical protein NYR78_03015 [Actinobacillus equuli subsp. haemolyticus]
MSNKQKPVKTQEIIEAVKKDPAILETPEIKAVMVHHQKIHSGPLPPAEDIVLYNQSIPNGGDRLMRMAEKSLDIAEKTQTAEIELRKEGQNIQKRGQWFAMTVVGCFTVLAIYIAYLGDTKTAALLMGAGLVSIVGAFLYSNKKQ